MSNVERTNWRDAGISMRHRHWGVACPATDLDFVLAERRFNEPVALVDYKNIHVKQVSFDDGNLVSVSKLGTVNQMPLPFFVVVYTDNFRWFAVCPFNETAKVILPVTQSVYQTMAENEYVDFLYKLRGQSLPLEVSQSLYCYKT